MSYGDPDTVGEVSEEIPVTTQPPFRSQAFPFSHLAAVQPDRPKTT
jgi:hypothetical protein